MSTMETVVAPSDLDELLAEVWSSYVGQPEELLPAAPVDWSGEGGAERTPCWSAAVSVTGGWHGMVAIDLAETAAVDLARAMLCLGADDEVEHADLTDAVGELVNIVGGNVKALVPGPSTLSLPAVAQSVLAAPSGLHLVLCLDLAWRGAPLRVRVLSLPPGSPLHQPLLEVSS